MSKFTLGQRQFPTLGLRSQQPKNYVGPTLSCHLGYNYIAKKICYLAIQLQNNSYPARFQHCTFRFPEWVLNYPAIRTKTVFSNSEYYMSCAYFQSVFSCGEYNYISMINICRHIVYCSNFREIMWSSFWLRSSLMTNFFVFGCHSLLCTNDYIARLYSKIDFNVSSGSYGVHVQVIQPFLKFPY